MPPSILPAGARGGTSILVFCNQPGAAERLVSFIRLFDGTLSLRPIAIVVQTETQPDPCIQVSPSNAGRLPLPQRQPSPRFSCER